MPSEAYADRDAERLVPEPATPGRTAFERDRARVLHSAALRRLAAKTQVVDPSDEVGDVPRTRLTHSLECAQIGRELGEALGCDPDLVDAACLAHDLGHPPFGHNGEAALDEVAAPCGGFEGNAQSLRLLTRLEAKVEGAGLNLTRAVLDAATKYPWPRREGSAKYGVYADDLPVYAWFREGVPEGARPVEAQVMDWADDVAYSVHDLEDGVRAGHVRLDDLRDRSERAELAVLAAQVYSDQPPEAHEAALDRLLALECWPTGYDGSMRAQAALKRATSVLIGRLCRAAEAATREVHGGGRLTRYAGSLVVPAGTRAECAVLKAVTARYVMARPGAAERQSRQRELVTELAGALAAGAPGTLEPLLRPTWDAAPDDAARLRVVVDQVALLTDLSATVRHAALVGRPS